MAKAAAELGDAVDAAGPSQSPDAGPSRPTREQLFRDNAALALEIHPNAVGCKLLILVPDGDQVSETRINISLAAAVVLTPTESKVMAFIRKLRRGEWVAGKTLAAEVELEYGGGQFTGLMSGLTKGKKLLESNNVLGYRVRLED